MTIKILGAHKSSTRNAFTFEKTQEFIKGFVGFLHDLDFSEFDIMTCHFAHKIDKKTNEPIMTSEVDINEYIDTTFNFENGKYNIELIFGKSKIFVYIYTKEDKQQEILDKIQKFSSFDL
ncbi:hypothetical protein ACFLQN_01145 [Candidatus Aenigmatarchaeota archaeon]